MLVSPMVICALSNVMPKTIQPHRPVSLQAVVGGSVQVSTNCSNVGYTEPLLVQWWNKCVKQLSLMAKFVNTHLYMYYSRQWFSIHIFKSRNLSLFFFS